MKAPSKTGFTTTLARRGVLAAGLGAAGGGMALLSTNARGEIAASSGQTLTNPLRPPSGVGGKFYPTGQVKEWPGNTIICPVGADTPLHEVLRSVQEAAMIQPVMRKFTLLPTSSLHMTLFEGVDLDHRRAPFWPAPVPLDAPLSAVDQWCAARLRTFHTGGGLFQMRPDPDVDIQTVTDFTVRLAPATEAQERRLRTLRDRLSAVLQIRSPAHDRYRFHITLGYLIDWLTPEEAERARQLFSAWGRRIATAAPEFTIGPPEFCRFRDMFAFTPLLTLAD